MRIVRRLLNSIATKLASHRFRGLVSGVPFQPVQLIGGRQTLSRHEFLRKVLEGVAVLGLGWIFVQGRAKAWLNEAELEVYSDSRDPERNKRDQLIAGHQDSPPVDAHTDNPGGHVDVPSEVGHANFDRPHTDSHFDSPHGDSQDSSEPTTPEPTS